MCQSVRSVLARWFGLVVDSGAIRTTILIGTVKLLLLVAKN